MSEITMPVDVMGIGAMTSVQCNSDSGGDGMFGEIMNAMLSAESAAVPIAEMTEPEQTQEGGLSRLMQMLTGQSDSLPEELSTEGAAAFLLSLKKFISSDSDEDLSKDIAALWENIPDDEMAAFVQVLELMTADNSQVGDDCDADNMLARFTAVCVKKLSSYKSDEKKEDDDSAAAYMVSDNIFDFALKTAEEIMIPDNSRNGQSEPVSAGLTESVKIQEVDISEIIQTVNYEISDKQPEDVRSFFDAMAKELNAQIEASKGNEGEADDPAQIFSTQRQAFMSRVNNAFSDDDTELTPSAAQTVLPDAAAVQTNSVQWTDMTEIPDVTEQIVSRLSFSEAFSTGEQKEITMRLAPEELGGLEIRIKSTDEGIVISFAAERSEAAELIGDKAAALAEAVAAKGIRLKEMTVTEQIVTQQSENNALDYSGSQFENGQSGGNYSEGQRFVFTETDSGIAVESAPLTSQEEKSEIYYNKEAKLWVSA